MNEHFQAAALTIRPARPQDIPQIAQVHIDSWQQTYTGILPEALISAQTPEKRVRDWMEWLASHQQVWILVAESKGRISGFISGGPERSGHPGYPGEIYALYLLADCQGQGWGRQLLLEGFSVLRRQGFTAALIWVARDNLRACHFYARQGGRPGPERILELMGFTVAERAYLWPDLTSPHLKQGLPPVDQNRNIS